MPESNDTPLTTIAHKEGMVILPYKEEQFYDFLKNLLGRPQTIEKTFRFSFALTPNDVAHLNGLITQRVAQQNDARLITFSAVLRFSDDSKVSFASVDDLNLYSEVKPVVSVGLELSWIYLIKFRDSEAPEKQEIELSFKSGSGEIETLEVFSSTSIQRRRVRANIRLLIRHSARTWATDIENLLTSALDSMAITESPSRNFVRNWQDSFGAVGFISSIVLYLTVLIFTIYQSEEQNRIAYMKISSTLKTTVDLEIIHKELNFLATKFLSGESTSFVLKAVLYFAASLIFAIFAATTLSSILPPPVGANILYTRKATENYTTKCNEHAVAWSSFIRSAIIGVITGVLGNYVFYWLMK